MKRLSLCLLTLVTSLACSHTAPTGGTATLTSPDTIKPLMLKTFNYQVADQAKKKSDGGWIRAAFYTGVTAAYRATNDPAYLTAALGWADTQGHWAPQKGDWRFADNYCNAQVYCELYELKHDPKMIEASRLDEVSQSLSVTISIGATCLSANDTPESIISRADALMYQSKRAGRNCVTAE